MLSEFNEAIHSRLTTDAGLIAVVPARRIANHIRDDAPFPHIDWRLDGVVRSGIKSEESYEGTIILEVFSDYDGDQECYDIHDLIFSALDRLPVNVSGFNNYELSFNSISVETEGDNRTRQATITYSFMLGEL